MQRQDNIKFRYKLMDIYRVFVSFCCVLFGAIIIYRAITEGARINVAILGVALFALGIYRFYLLYKLLRGY
jgi:hypothetical protein